MANTSSHLLVEELMLDECAECSVFLCWYAPILWLLWSSTLDKLQCHCNHLDTPCINTNWSYLNFFRVELWSDKMLSFHHLFHAIANHFCPKYKYVLENNIHLCEISSKHEKHILPLYSCFQCSESKWIISACLHGSKL